MRMSNNKADIKYGEILPPPRREVGVKIGGQVYVPAVPFDAGTMNAYNRYLDAHIRAVSLIDQYHVLREQYAANRAVVWRPSADVAAQEEEETELKHQRERAKRRRERELIEDELAVVNAQHALEAAEEFKEIKFATGAARFAEKTARFRVGEAVAQATMGARPAEAQQPKPDRPPLADALLAGIDDLEKQIGEREAGGGSAEALHTQRDALRELLMRELRKGS
jgi:hypothetical protein